MSFEEFEESRDRGEPINLFLFEYGPSIEHRLGLTDFEQPILFNGLTYQPQPADRGTIKASGTLDKSELELRTDRENPIAELFRIYPPSQTVRVTIYQGHADDPAKQYLVVWTGRVLNVKWEQSECRLSCEPISTSLRRPGLRRRYQFSCPHVLYGSMCQASKAAATKYATLAEPAEGSRKVKVNYTLAEDELRTYRGGTVEWTTPSGLSESRTILGIEGDGNLTTFVLSGIVRELLVGGQVALVKGCAHNMDDCGKLHNNILNYGGMPWFPTKNPIGSYSPYY